MSDYNDLIDQLKNQTVLCVGDMMADEFVYGDTNRISPEAPTPVLLIKRTEMMIGGAGNVAKNLSSLGVKCIFVSVIADDLNGQKLQQVLNADPLIESHLVQVNDRPTTHKVRFVSEKHLTHLLRADFEKTLPVSIKIEDKIIEIVKQKMSCVGAVILSDYAKGLLTPRVIKAIIDLAHEFNKPVVVDPTGSDYSIYQNADILTPNQHELSVASHQLLTTDDEVVHAAENIINKSGHKAILVTRSEKGMTLVKDNQFMHVPARPVLVRDVSGAGDTVVAIFASLLAMQADYTTATFLANMAASIVVAKNGTATLTIDELHSVLFPQQFLLENKFTTDFNLVKPYIENLKKQGLKIGFTNGCFDLLHPGHVQLLNASRQSCDFLIVGLNSDASVSRLKGKDRPVQNAYARASVLTGLSAVDLVVIFEEDTPQNLIEQIIPNVLIKGADYKKENIVGASFVEHHGGKVMVVELIPEQSTTKLITKLKMQSVEPVY